MAEPLSLLERKLALLRALDAARDRVASPDGLLVEVTEIAREFVDADLCVLGVWDGEAGRVIARVVVGTGGEGEEDWEDLLARGMVSDRPVRNGLADEVRNKGWADGIVLPLVPGGEPLGALLVLRRERPFDADALALLETAGEQIDSALAQAQMVQTLFDRQRELELIYRLDRIRDETPEMEGLLTRVGYEFAREFAGELCLICLWDEDRERLDLRAVEDRGRFLERVGAEALAREARWAFELEGVTRTTAAEVCREVGLDYVLATSFGVAGKRLGCFLAFRAERPFSRAEADRLAAAVTQIVSALVFAQTYGRLRERNQELEVIYRVDRIRDQQLPLDTMLDLVLRELCRVIRAEMGFVMLFDPQGRELSLRAATEDDLFRLADEMGHIRDAAEASIREARLIDREHLSERIRSLICVPLILNERIIGVFGVINRLGGGQFTRADRRMLAAITSQIDTAIFEHLERRRLREVFGLFVSPAVLERMLESPTRDYLRVERLPVSVLFADLRGFTHLAEQISPDRLVSMLNEFFERMVDVVFRLEGTLDKFIGDAVMALFNVPHPQADHSLRAVRAALAMQEAHKELKAHWRWSGEEMPPLGVGINTGEAVVGNIGSARRMDYTAVGDVVNIASRVCALARGGQILITEAVYACVRDMVEVRALPATMVKGRSEPVQLYEVLGIRGGGI